MNHLLKRPRRNRRNQTLRSLLEETELRSKNLIAPLFIEREEKGKSPIHSLPGQYRFGLKSLVEEAKELEALGVSGVCLFPVIPSEQKDAKGSMAVSENNFYLEAIKEVKKACPYLLVMTDVALDPYTDHGHDGLLDQDTGEILNDPTLEVLGRMSVLQARAGADFIGPSDMMDGRVGFIRRELDREGFTDAGIISYSVKYASSFYGPFRDALKSAPKAGDKKTYQMNVPNSIEALREARLDEEEGADILLVKPALTSLDVIWRLKQNFDLPIAAYQVSGEYAMMKSAFEAGFLSEPSSIMESLLVIKRAGASVILSYFAKSAAMILENQKNFCC